MIEIRPIEQGDFEDWRMLWTQYLEFYKTSVEEDVYHSTFNRLTSAEHPDQNGFLALLEGKAVGHVHYLFHPHFWRTEKVTYLGDLFVDPSARGHGVGKKLIESVYEAADQAKAPYVYWTTQEFNSTARRIYDRVGEKTPFIKYQRGKNQ